MFFLSYFCVDAFLLYDLQSSLIACFRSSSTFIRSSFCVVLNWASILCFLLWCLHSLQCSLFSSIVVIKEAFFYTHWKCQPPHFITFVIGFANQVQASYFCNSTYYSHYRYERQTWGSFIGSWKQFSDEICRRHLVYALSPFLLQPP